jgi:hypothetical protein
MQKIAEKGSWSNVYKTLYSELKKQLYHYRLTLFSYFSLYFSFLYVLLHLLRYLRTQ